MRCASTGRQWCRRGDHVASGRQPAVQHRDAAHLLTCSIEVPAIDRDARDGAARGGRATRGARRRRRLRHPVGEGGVSGPTPRSSATCRRRSSCPPPKVESSLVRIVRRTSRRSTSTQPRLFALVRAGFGQRRKMLRRSLAGMVTAEQFVAAGMSRPKQRAEELDGGGLGPSGAYRRRRGFGERGGRMTTTCSTARS